MNLFYRQGTVNLVELGYKNIFYKYVFNNLFITVLIAKKMIKI